MEEKTIDLYADFYRVKTDPSESTYEYRLPYCDSTDSDDTNDCKSQQYSDMLGFTSSNEAECPIYLTRKDDSGAETT